MNQLLDKLPSTLHVAFSCCVQVLVSVSVFTNTVCTRKYARRNIYTRDRNACMRTYSLSMHRHIHTCREGQSFCSVEAYLEMLQPNTRKLNINVLP